MTWMTDTHLTALLQFQGRAQSQAVSMCLPKLHVRRHLIEVSCGNLPCSACKVDVVGVVHFAEVVEAAGLSCSHMNSQHDYTGWYP